MSFYLEQYYIVKYFCNKPKSLSIPFGDYDAYQYYINRRHLYNKLWVATSQNLLCGELTKAPHSFPIIVRPKVNLDGMGKDSKFIYNISEFKKLRSSHLCWVEKLKGNHYSVDIFLNAKGIQGIICFQGYPGSKFTFQYWEYLESYSLPLNIQNWISMNLISYRGVFNLEIIGDKIIECHLRIGDLIFFQDHHLLQLVINCHLDKDIVFPKLPKIFLIPIFVPKEKFFKLEQSDIWKAVRASNSYNSIRHFKIDFPSECSNPPGGNRICICSFNNLSKGQIFREKIYQNLSKDKLLTSW